MIHYLAIMNLLSPRVGARPARSRAGGFTLVEMLVVMSIILSLAGMTMVGMSWVRQEACAARTKATIAKINQILMQKWESYESRPVPIDFSQMDPITAAKVRRQAIYYLQKFEMPDRMSDLVDAATANGAIQFGAGFPNGTSMPYPLLASAYPKPTKTTFIHAKMLYMVCTTGNPEVLELFNDSEIGDYDGDGFKVFLDGWGHPIYYLRWAPGYSPYSDIQSGNAATDPDPFDPRKVGNGFHLFPLIYSAGPDWRLEYPADKPAGVVRGYGINTERADAQPNGQMPSDPFDPAYLNVGTPAPEEPTALFDNITNHRIEH